MDQNDITSATAGDAGSPEPAETLPLEQVADLIWKSTEHVLDLLRTYATSEVQKKKRGHIWLNEVSRAQSNTILAIKQLCDTFPEGVSLKKLAETVGVTPAAVSVTVEILVSKKIIKRTQSKDDRRGILLSLTPQTQRLFEIVDQSLGQAVLTVADELGPQTLRDWLNMQQTAIAVLERTVGQKRPPKTAAEQAAEK